MVEAVAVFVEGEFGEPFAAGVEEAGGGHANRGAEVVVSGDLAVGGVSVALDDGRCGVGDEVGAAEGVGVEVERRGVGVALLDEDLVEARSVDVAGHLRNRAR